MGRLSNSINLFKSSWAVLRQDKELLALPVLSGVASILTVVLFAIPVWTSIDVVDDAAGSSVEASPVAYLLIALAYFVLAFITVFFNSALVHAANERMAGGDPTVSSALGGAAERINRILPWALLSATVSQIIRAIQDRGGLAGSILGFLGGIAWAAATFLVLPILVIENIGPVDAIKRSAGLLRSAWGEGLAGHAGLGILGFVAVLPFVAVGALGVAAGTVALTVPAIAVAVLGVLAVVIVMSALSVVYQTALYRFATQQAVPAYSSADMADAFYRKNR